MAVFTFSLHICCDRGRHLEYLVTDYDHLQKSIKTLKINFKALEAVVFISYHHSIKFLSSPVRSKYPNQLQVEQDMPFSPGLIP